MAKDLDVGLRFVREVSKTLETGIMELCNHTKILPTDHIYTKMRKSEISRTHSVSDYADPANPTVPEHLTNVVTASEALILLGEEKLVYSIISEDVLNEYKKALEKDF